ncbi:Crinkler (CRN) [Phytophthora megakarya]|uniref:Crinkler (CRN) n=1 Tax=Phytophthora megakarya TaxID=4795 RepID=A0A225VSY9_9STRA|nr:Crinkler (CRN) [Phytophthora megakarya]
MVNLSCAIVGVVGRFPVNIDENETVGDLKDAIKDKKPNDLKDVDADKLQLFLAKTADGAWLDEAGVVAVALDERGRPHGFGDQMEPAKWIKNAKYFGENFQPGECEVHVLVVVPDSSVPVAKRQRTDATRSDELVALIEMGQRLKRDTKQLAVGQLLKLPRTVVLDVNFTNDLYIRQEYWDLYELIEQQTPAHKLHRILVIGSPGIGKSVFGVFLLLVFMTKEKDIAYRCLNRRLIYFSWNDAKGYEISDEPVRGKKYEGLFDGNDSGALSFDQFLHTVCMNPWTKAECQSLADTMDLEDEDEWLRRFNIVGGKPRYLFSGNTTYEDLLDTMNASIPRDIAGLKDMVQLFGQKQFDDRMKHILFLFNRNKDKPGRLFLTYASLAVEAQVSTRYNIDTADRSTVSESHPIKLQHLKNVYLGLMGREGGEFSDYTHILLFIVSDDIYDDFPAQPYKTVNGKDRKTEIDISVTQYVGKIAQQ